MGREAECICEWNGVRHSLKALLEPPDLVLRGAIRRRLSISAMQQVHADGEHLRFVYQGESLSLIHI